MSILTSLALIAAALCTPSVAEAKENYAELFAERVRSVVVVEFFIQREVEREPKAAVGLVLDEKGWVALLDGIIPHWTPVDDLRDFKVFIPGESGDEYQAEYLGVDFISGWHFIRVEEALHEHLVPITHYPEAKVQLGEQVWGIGIGGDYMDYPGYFLHGRVSSTYRLPLNVSFTTAPVAAQGGPVFNQAGAFVGWAGQAASQEYILYTGEHTLRVALQSLNEANVFLHAEDLLQRVERFPADASRRPQPWLGISGLQAVEPEAAPFLGVEDQGAVVVGDIFVDGPADRAGLLSGDVIVAVEGETLPRMRPDSVVVAYLEEQMLKRPVGSAIGLTVLRDGSEVELQLVSTEHTQLLREANRQYFPRIGLTVREYVLYDSAMRRHYETGQKGAVVHFVRENGPAAAAGLQEGDWVRQVDGQEVVDYNQVVELFSAAEEDRQRRESVLLVDRNNETRVLRIKLD